MDELKDIAIFTIGFNEIGIMELEFRNKVVVVTGGANGIGKCIVEEFRARGAEVYVIDKQEGDHFVGVTAPFYLVKLLKPYMADGASIINISSSRDRMSQPQTESYTAAGRTCR